jgi:hypothetical protein
MDAYTVEKGMKDVSIVPTKVYYRDGDYNSIRSSMYDDHQNYIRVNKEIVEIILERKGYDRYSGSNKNRASGKYLFGHQILAIINEKPEWIKTKISSKKFGL